MFGIGDRVVAITSVDGDKQYAGHHGKVVAYGKVCYDILVDFDDIEKRWGFNGEFVLETPDEKPINIGISFDEAVLLGILEK